MCADFLSHCQRLLVRNRLHFAGSEGFGSGAVVSQVKFSADKYDRDIGRVVLNLGVPLD